MGRKPSRENRRTQRARKQKRADKVRADGERLESSSLTLGPKTLSALVVFALAVAGICMWRLSLRGPPEHEHQHQHDPKNAPLTSARGAGDKALNPGAGPDSSRDEGR